jgi:hypothetical protein
MSWVERVDEGIVDLMAWDQECHKVALLPDARRDVVLRQKARLTAIVAQYTAADGTIDWTSVSVGFQAHVDRLLKE